MPSHRDFDVARDAAHVCLMASSYLLASAREAVPDATKAVKIAAWLGHLAWVLSGAHAAVARVEDELTTAALATGVVRAGGMVRRSAHRLAVDLASDMGMAIGWIAPGLVPRGLSPPFPELLPSDVSGILAMPAVPVALVEQHLPAIVAKLALPADFDAPYVDALVQQERMRAINRLESERTEAAADQQAPPPEAEPADLANWSGTPKETPIEPAAAGPTASPRGDRQAAGADASGSKDGRLDVPPCAAFAAYRATKILRQRQEDVAREFGVSQGTISRWVTQAAKWIKAGNILPDLDAPRPKTVTMDPRKLEQGPRLQ
jgi:hypothetical protein